MDKSASRLSAPLDNITAPLNGNNWSIKMVQNSDNLLSFIPSLYLKFSSSNSFTKQVISAAEWIISGFYMA